MSTTVYIDVNEEMMDEIERKASAMQLEAGHYIRLVLAEALECPYFPGQQQG